MTIEERDALLDALRCHPGMRSVRWLVLHQDITKRRAHHGERLEMYERESNARRLVASGHFRRKDNKLDRQRILQAERLSLLKSHVFPVMRNMFVADFGPSASMLQRAGEGSAERMANLFVTAMPALELFAHMMSDLTMNPSRRTRRQDFWDLEHAAIAPIYADAFVTSDTWLQDRIAGAEKLGLGGAQVLASVSELSSWLRAHCQPSTR